MEIKEDNIIFLTVIMVCVTELCSLVQGSNTETDIIQKLLDSTSYNSNIPPENIDATGTQSPISVSVQLTINDIVLENEQNMEISCLLYVIMMWTDNRLDYSHNATVPYLLVPDTNISNVWVPDIFIQQNRKAYFTGVIEEDKLIYIGRFGNITFSGRIVTTLFCRMDLQRFPYDVQHCQINLKSYKYTQERVQLYWISDDKMASGPNFKECKRNRTFDITLVGIFSQLNLTLEIMRSTHSESQVIYTPAVLVGTAMMSFFFSDNFTPRIVLSGACMTTIIMHWVGIYNKVRPAAVLMWLDRWMLINLCFVAVIILFTAFNYHIQGNCQSDCLKRIILYSVACVSIVLCYISFAISYSFVWKLEDNPC